MPQIKIQILSVAQHNVPKKNKPGETYGMLELAYKNLTFQGKVEGRKQMSFGGNKGGYDALLEAKMGEIYDVEVVKVGDFNEWQSAKKSDGATATTGAATTSPVKAAYGGSVGKSSYPTDEERAKTQVYIVRQSNLAQAINLLSVGAKTPPSVDNVIATAKLFEDHVFGNSNDKIDTASSFDELEDKDDFPDMPQ